MFLLALVMTIATHGAVLPLFIGMAVSIGFGVVISGIQSAVNGEGFWEGAFTGFVDGVFWGGVFAFITASIQTIKYGINAIRASRAANVETFYRAMSADDFAYLQNNGRVRATRETFVTKDLNYAKQYNGITVEITVKKGTTNKLQVIGVRDGSEIVRSTYPGLMRGGKGWTTNFAYFKGEGGIINIGLGKGKALEIFNKNIIKFKLV